MHLCASVCPGLSLSLSFPINVIFYNFLFLVRIVKLVFYLLNMVFQLLLPHKKSPQSLVA